MTEWLTTTEVAEEIKKSPDYVAKLCKAKQIHAIKLGNDWRISREALNTFMNGGKAKPARSRELTARQQKRAS